jgi:3-phenylpropionate/trans-cinnamate dioxygenase ferredoxin subunit
VTAAAEFEPIYVRACSVAALRDESAIGVVLRAPGSSAIDDVPVCLVKTHGEVFAISDICSHADVNLSDGEVDSGTVECWLHGSRFDVRSGNPTGRPANLPVPTYPVKIDGDDILVSLKES